MNPLRSLIRRFDAWLCRRHAVLAFSDDPLCILRIQVKPLEHPLDLQGVSLPAWAKVLRLHIWNERAPLIPPGGPGLEWALDYRRRLVHSMRLVARQIFMDPGLQGVQAVGGVTAHILLCGGGGKALFERMGFQVIPYYRPAGKFGEFWENFFTWWLMWAFNPPSTRNRSMFRLQRVEFWMTIGTFMEKYG